MGAPISLALGPGHYWQDMTRSRSSPVVHLELHTGDLPGACAFYSRLCGWRPARIEAGGGTYWAFDELGGEFGGGGVVECATDRPLWLPYVEVEDIADATRRARGLGASVLLEPREGPAGWRSVVSAPAGGEIAFWQQKSYSAAAAKRSSA
jgi:predicted enzyme related to lactoylglutathione lyase